MIEKGNVVFARLRRGRGYNRSNEKTPYFKLILEYWDLYGRAPAVRVKVQALSLDPLYSRMAVLIEQPWLAAAPLAVFLVLYALLRNRLVLAAAAAWLLYLPYEYSLKLRILCTGECNIRIDLLVLYPALVFISAAGVVAFLWSLGRVMRERAK